MKLVYKYLPPKKYALDFLSNGKLRISQLMALNDPFECLSFYAQAHAEKICEQMHGENWRQRVNPPLPFIEALMPSVLMSVAADFLNDKIGILSLSKTWSSSKMWGYYTDKHSGFCIGFDADFWGGVTDEKEYGRLCPVKYSETRSMCDLTKSEAPSKNNFFNKSKEWAHEEEVRAIYELKEEDAVGYDDLAERVYCKTFPFEAIKEIIVGCFASGGLERACLNFSELHGIPCYSCRAQLENETYKMARRAIKKTSTQVYM